MALRLWISAGLVGLVTACGSPEAAPEPVPWPAEQARAWDVSLHTRLFLGGELDQPTLDVQLEGTWQWTPLEQDAAHTTFHVQLVDPTLTLLKATDPRVVEQLEGELGEPLVVTQSTNGAVTAIQTSQDVTTFARSLIEGMIGAQQFVVVPTSAASWEVEEADSNGRYLAGYVTVDDGSVVKVRERYVREATVELPPGTPQPERHTEVVDDHTEFAFDGGGLARLKAVSTIDVQTPGLAGRARSKLAMTMSDRRTSPAVPATALRQQLPKLAAARAIDVAPAPTLDPVHRDARKVAGRDLGALREAYAEAQDADDGRARLDAFLGLVGVVRLDDAAAVSAHEAILGGAPDARPLMTALGHASTPTSLAALVGLVEDSTLDDEGRRYAMRSLAKAERPTPELVAFYQRTLQDDSHGRQARLGLGSATRHLLEHDPELAARALKTLLREVTSAETVGELTGTLRAIGNSTAPEALETVRPFLADANPRVRAAALTALRGMDHPEVDGLLARAFVDEAEVVRHASLTAARDREPSATLVTAVARASREEPELLPRVTAVRALAEWLPKDPAEVRPALEAVRDHEAEPGVRGVAEKALARHAG